MTIKYITDFSNEILYTKNYHIVTVQTGDMVIIIITNKSNK